MKTRVTNLFILPVLIVGFDPALAGRVAAQTFRTLHSFTATSPPTNSDGALPHSGSILSGNTLYGTAGAGGTSGNGTVFAVNTDGTGFTNLHSFAGGSDGANPYSGLVLSGNTLYGTTQNGGSSGKGTVFRVNTDGTAYTNLHSFNYDDGDTPQAGLILSDHTLYGTTRYGGSYGYGTVFAVNTDGTGFTNLYGFAGMSDAGDPWGGLILSGNMLVGTTFGAADFSASGPHSGTNGTVFAINTDGTSYTNLHVFDYFSEGGKPEAGLILSGSTLYGTAAYGGSFNGGTVFKIKTDGTGFTVLHNFSPPWMILSRDGARPEAGLILLGNTLYGTSNGGGSAGYGTLFAVETDGTGFGSLYSFTGGSGGAEPDAGLVSLGNTLYGTTPYGGSVGNGMMFSLFARPKLTIIGSDANVVLTWPTNAVGFTLQCTTNLASTAAWGTVSPDPVVVNGQNTVTNPISGTLKFYRLSQ